MCTHPPRGANNWIIPLCGYRIIHLPPGFLSSCLLTRTNPPVRFLKFALNIEKGDRTKNFSDSKGKKQETFGWSSEILVKKREKCEGMLKFIKLTLCGTLMLYTRGLAGEIGGLCVHGEKNIHNKVCCQGALINDPRCRRPCIHHPTCLRELVSRKRCAEARVSWLIDRRPDTYFCWRVLTAVH
jgi:hypothetical protein